MELKLSKPRGAADWLRLYRLYLEAFPVTERKPWGMIRKMYRLGKTDVWCLLGNGKFAGLAITINSPDIILLDYLAVCGSCRGQGVGTAALQALRSHYPGMGLFVEIESTLAPTPDLQLRLRRKAFYLRSGMTEMHTTAKLFGVDMELLGYDCHLDYDGYKAFYFHHYNAWAADHIQKASN